MDKFTKRITRTYWLELGAAIALYTVFIFTVMPNLHRFEVLWQRSALALLPMVPFILGMIAIFRHFRRMDEFQRAQAFEVISIASAGTMFLTFGYGFLEIAGWPQISMFWVWMTMGALWFITNQIYRLFGRHHP